MGLIIIARKSFALHQILDNRIDYRVGCCIMTSFRRPDSLCIIPYTVFLQRQLIIHYCRVFNVNKKEHNSLHFIFSDAAARENIKVNVDCIGYASHYYVISYSSRLHWTGEKRRKSKGRDCKGDRDSLFHARLPFVDLNVGPIMKIYDTFAR